MIIDKMTATIDGEEYEFIPSADCKGCAFVRECFGEDGDTLTDDTPEFNGYVICADLDGKFVKLHK